MHDPSLQAAQEATGKTAWREIARLKVDKARADGDPLALARALYLLGRAELEHYDHPQAAAHFDEALEVLPREAPPSLRAEIQLARAENLFKLNNYRESLEAANDALRIAVENDDRLTEALALEGMGAAYAQLSLYQQAVQTLTDALQRFEKLGRPELRGRTFNYLAVVYEEVGDYSHAFKFYEESLSALRETGNRDMEARVLANLGEAYVNRGEFDRALLYLDQARALAEDLGEHNLTGYIFEAISRIHIARGERRDARACLDRAVEEHYIGHSKRHRAEALASLGRFLADENDYEGAVAYLERALALLEEIQVQRELYRVHVSLAEVHQRFGNVAKALEHFRSYDRIHSAVLEDTARAKIAAQATEFEVRQMRREREIVEKKNAELAKANEELKRLNAELAEHTKRLNEYAMRDNLTGLSDRRCFIERLASTWEQTRRQEGRLAVVLVDVDDLRKINERHSHATGDDVLRQVGRLVTERLPATAVAGRYDGDTFAILLPAAGLDAAVTVAESIRAAAHNHPWTALRAGLAVTLSIGVVADATLPSWETLLLVAEARCAAARRGGGDRVVTHD
ncbi:MAG TPA: diguanylate cyclase [Gammaproteobacteria bacterium]|nr:diguanylate cyclase [Gammaproteobacteria bacterium]